MDASKILIIMIIFCISAIALLMFSKPLKWAFKFLLNGVIGTLGFFIANLLLSPMSLAVGINFLTISIVSLLGIPGFISLYLLQIML